MTMTDGEIEAKTAAAWEALDQLETDVLMGALLAIDDGRELMNSEQAVLDKFAELCGIHDHQAFMEIITKEIRG